MSKKCCKYRNPISPVVTVEVPKWEYAGMVGAATTLNIIEKVFRADKYRALDLMQIVFDDADEEYVGKALEGKE